MPYQARRAARLVAAVLLVFLLGLPALAAAQSSYQVRFAKAENTIRTHEPTITWWEHQSQITLGIGLTIVALGIATGVLQALTRPWTRPATLVVGALVTAMTAVNTTFFDGDYKTLMNRAREGRTIIAGADRFMALAPSLPTDGDREEALRYIQESAEALALLVGGGAKGRPVADADQLVSIIPSPFVTLFAASGNPCGCAAFKSQETPAYRYFCGQGTARSLSEARKAATEEGIAQANIALQNARARASDGDLTSYLRTVASEVAACPVGSARGFTMFVLLRVPTTLTTESARQAFVKPVDRRARVRLQLERIRVIEDGSTGSTGWSFDVRAGGKTFSLPNRNYSDRPAQNEFAPASTDGAVLEIDVDGSSPARVEIIGRRSFGGDTATGVQTLSPGMPAVVIDVRHPGRERNGAFQFTFSMTPTR